MVKLVKLPERMQVDLALPAALASELRWSDNGEHFAFTDTTPHGIELWLGDPLDPNRISRCDVGWDARREGEENSWNQASSSS